MKSTFGNGVMDCDVIIPVGPGHERIMEQAVMSVSIAADHSKGPFENITIRAFDDTQGNHGRSSARNQAVQASDSDWIYYLDADDMVLPGVFESWLEGYDAIWGNFGEIKDLLIYERYQVPTVSSYQQLINYNPQLTVKIGHFVKREVALKYPFNTEMNAGEDWDYYLRVWKNERCIKVSQMTYVKTRGNHSTGPKSANGREWSISVMDQIEKARAELNHEFSR